MSLIVYDPFLKLPIDFFHEDCSLPQSWYFSFGRPWPCFQRLFLFHIWVDKKQTPVLN